MNGKSTRRHTSRCGALVLLQAGWAVCVVPAMLRALLPFPGHPVCKLMATRIADSLPPHPNSAPSAADLGAVPGAAFTGVQRSACSWR